MRGQRCTVRPPGWGRSGFPPSSCRRGTCLGRYAREAEGLSRPLCGESPRRGCPERTERQRHGGSDAGWGSSPSEDGVPQAEGAGCRGRPGPLRVGRQEQPGRGRLPGHPRGPSSGSVAARDPAFPCLAAATSGNLPHRPLTCGSWGTLLPQSWVRGSARGPGAGFPEFALEGKGSAPREAAVGTVGAWAGLDSGSPSPACVQDANKAGTSSQEV